MSVRLVDSTEAAFEALIVESLTTAGGWEQGEGGSYDAELALYPDDSIDFIRDTQPKKWRRLVALGGNEESARTSLLSRLATELDRRGAVDVLRRGIKERGVEISLCQLRPAHSIDERTQGNYEANRLRVVRQVPFDPVGSDSLDLGLFVNGVPTATAELKNRWTGQTVQHAVAQYRKDRDPRNRLLSRRAFVHFALDAELVYMTTHLDGERTNFLPFNQGSGGPGQPGGAGNPAVEGRHPTSYLWEQIWERDHWLELIQKFVHAEPSQPGSKRTKPTIVFPRYHQWDVVCECAAHAKLHGAGQTYLIQHSAGSGKTKEIAWLAHELSSLHDRDDAKAFDKVVVITDRRALDRQLQEQVAQFEQVRGVVRSIEGGSADLREALASDAAKIVVSTLQKFPHVLKAIDGAQEFKNHRYAVIVDEAHSSQSGDSAADLKGLLGAKTVDELDLEEADGVPPALLARLAGQGRQPNLSFFAFTATPKAKTLELFGSRDGGDPRPFHTYSMRQAIEEGFIVDVLRNYTTYRQLYKLEAKASEEVELPKGRASRRLASFAKLHPHAKAQKAAVVADHFRKVVRPLIGGAGKAIVVTSGREEAVRWQQALERVIEERGYTDLETLVAFSGTVEIDEPGKADSGATYTEPQMNAIDGRSLPEKKLPEEFEKAKYGILVVAEKYQTGFDQPKLCGMYVDKKLGGVNAVQTLSRLNRAFGGKEDVYVLDFSNSTEEIEASFAPYYEETTAVPTDPDVLFDAEDELLAHRVIGPEDLDHFLLEWSRAQKLEEVRRHAILSSSTQPAYDVALALSDAALAALREDLDRFVRFYAFLSQVLPYVPPRTEVLFLFARVLGARLLTAQPRGGLNIADLVQLSHYRLEESGSESLELGAGEPLTAISGDGRGLSGEEPIGELGELVGAFNERYGAELSDADLIRALEPVRHKISENERIRDQALSNEFEDFLVDKEGVVVSATLAVKEIGDEIVRGLLDDDLLRAQATRMIMRAIYEKVRE